MCKLIGLSWLQGVLQFQDPVFCGSFLAKAKLMCHSTWQKAVTSGTVCWFANVRLLSALSLAIVLSRSTTLVAQRSLSGPRLSSRVPRLIDR